MTFKVLKISLIIFFFSQIIYCQNIDTIKFEKYTPDFKFKDGIFLSIEQVKDNNPIPKEKLLVSIDYNSSDFFKKVTDEEKLKLFDNLGIVKEIPMNEIWGFASLGALYINYNEDFNRVPVIGTISHFVSEFMVKNDQYYDPYHYNNPYYYDPTRNVTYTTKELRQYIFDFESGKVFDFDRQSLSVLMMKDPELYDEFNALSKRKQNKMLFYYLRKFNERNPLYIKRSDNQNNN